MEIKRDLEAVEHPLDFDQSKALINLDLAESHTQSAKLKQQDKPRLNMLDFYDKKDQRNFRSTEYYRKKVERKEAASRLAWEIVGASDNYTSYAALSVRDFLGRLSASSNTNSPTIKLDCTPSYSRVTLTIKDGNNATKVKLVDHSRWQVKNGDKKWQEVSLLDASQHANTMLGHEPANTNTAA